MKDKRRQKRWWQATFGYESEIILRAAAATYGETSVSGDETPAKGGN
jgi:hypothetical protein